MATEVKIYDLMCMWNLSLGFDAWLNNDLVTRLPELFGIGAIGSLALRRNQHRPLPARFLTTGILTIGTVLFMFPAYFEGKFGDLIALSPAPVKEGLNSVRQAYRGQVIEPIAGLWAKADSRLRELHAKYM